MALEFYLRTPGDDRYKTDYQLLEPCAHSGLYVDYSMGEKQLIGAYCDLDGTGFIETFDPEGILDTDECKQVNDDDLPEPFSKVHVDPELGEYSVIIEQGDNEPLEMIVRYHSVGEICLGGSQIIIPTNLIHHN
ncbi:MAG TPA: hypothetical protein VG964_00720 [Candidatus Saccharimonadales bacterium]|nr:hypothetical protein [Candidatus Saccharimonadales bacterium]